MTSRPMRIIAATCLALSGGALAGCAPARTHESTGEYLDDSVITTKVKAALLGEPDLRSFQIGVETYKGQVQLSGFVDAPGRSRRASEVAMGVPGVSSVRNDLIVK